MANAEGLAMGPGATKKAVQRGAENLGRYITPHGLRATFATGHWEVGTPLSQIAQMMGDSPEVVMEHYIFQRPKDQASEKIIQFKCIKLEILEVGSSTISAKVLAL